MQCLLTIAYALVTPFGGFVLLTGCGCAWQCTGDTGTTSYSSLSKAVLCFIKQCFVLSNCAIIGSNNLCTVFWGGAATHSITNCSERYNEDGRRCHRKQANIHRETYTSQLMKGGHFTMNLPLFISSANFLLMKSLLLVLFRGLCSLLRLTAQQKIHW